MHRLCYHLFYCIFLGLVTSSLFAQDQISSRSAPQALQLTVRRVNPGGSVGNEDGDAQGYLGVDNKIVLQNNNAEVYMVNNGDVASVPINQPKDQGNPADSPAEKLYQDQIAAVSQKIVDKINEKNKKQYDLDNEVYLVARAPLGIDLININKDLDNLQEQRLQLESQHTVTKVQQKNFKSAIKAAPSPPSNIISMKPVVKGSDVTLFLSNNKASGRVRTKVGHWVKAVAGDPKAAGQDIWVKVDLAQEPKPGSPPANLQ